MEQENNDIIHTLDEGSFESIFNKDFKGLCFFALSYVKDMEVAREIVQDSFIALWEKRSTIDLSKAVKTYLTTTIRNKCFNYLRDNKKFNHDIINLENLNIEAEYADSKLAGKEIKKEIDEAIAELPEKCREIFILSRFENKKYQEIADMLGISIKTVETQMSKALQHMRLRLSDHLSLFLLMIEIVYKNK